MKTVTSPGTPHFFVLVPPVRLERTLLSELDFESSASTNSATGARGPSLLAKAFAACNQFLGAWRR
jgi:hypothetical protein